MARDYTALPFEYLEEMDYLSDAEYGRLIRALQNYSITGEEPEKLSGQEKGHWKRVRNREDRYRVSFDASDRAKSERGAKAANARWSKAKNAQAYTSIHMDADECKQMLDDASDAKTDTDTDSDTKADAEYLSPPASPACAGEPESGPDGGEEPDPTHDPELGRVMTYFLDKLNPMPPSIAVEGLKNYTASLGADVVIHAMEICLGEKKTSWSYLRRILMRYESEGLRSMEAVHFSEQEHDARQSRKFTAQSKQDDAIASSAPDAGELERMRKLRERMKGDHHD